MFFVIALSFSVLEHLITFFSLLKMPGGIHAPIEEILRWPIGNYINPTTRPNTILLTACICGPITCTMLMTRLWVRMFHQRNPGWDDWLMVAATVCSHHDHICCRLTNLRFLLSLLLCYSLSVRAYNHYRSQANIGKHLTAVSIDTSGTLI